MPDPMRDKGSLPYKTSFSESVFRDYAEGLHVFLRKRMASREDADDVFQTIFERLAKVKKTELVDRPRAYLFGIAFHVVREFYLQEKRHSVVSFDSQAIEKADASLQYAQDDDVARRQSLVEQLERNLAALPDKQRRVLLAVKRDGLTYEEASRVTGISLHMVRKLIVQAKARMLEMTWDR